MKTARIHRHSLRRAGRAGIATLLLTVGACSTDRILKADRPDQIDPEQLSRDLQGARALASGAIGDFTVAYDGGAGGGAGLGQIMASGYLSDEFKFGGTPPELREMDLRNVREANGAWLQTYIDLHRAREAAQRAAGALRAVAASDPLIAEMYALQGALLVMQAGNPALFIQKLNEARTPYAGLTPLTDPGTVAARVDLLFRERAFAMFGTSHRVGDLRHLTRQYNRPAETVWPTGAYHKDNLTRGPDTNIVVPLSEKNNPNFTGCTSRNP